MSHIVHKHDIVEIPDFFTKEECEKTIQFFKDNPANWEETCFFGARVISPDQAAQAGVSDAYDIDHFWGVRARFEKAAEEVFGKKLRNLGISGHIWGKGAFAGRHSDNHDLNGNPQDGWIENKLVTIIYLNDDYEGGRLVFPDHGIDIAPKQGTLVVFDVGVDNYHAVSEVLDGTRFTMMSSFDFADSVYSDEYLAKKEAEREETRKLHEMQQKIWKETGKPEANSIKIVIE